MPVYPIGAANRSGKLGSPYAIADYKRFNPELGTLDQFNAMVGQAHRMGIYVIVSCAPCSPFDGPHGATPSS